jgi:hypothetical protein
VSNEPTSTTREDEWLWGWDTTPGIVSVWADANGRAFVWRRIKESGALVQEEERFRPWILLDGLDDLRHLGPRLAPEGSPDARVWYRELEGPGELRFLVSAPSGGELANAVLHGASRRLDRPVEHLRALGAEHVLALPPEEQYLVATGRTYFRGLAFDDLHRLQFDLETTGLDAKRDRIFMVAVRDPAGETHVLEAEGRGDEAEAELIRRLVDHHPGRRPRRHREPQPARLRPPLRGRAGAPAGRAPTARPHRRAWAFASAPPAAAPRAATRGGGCGSWRPGRELIDTMDAVIRYDFSARELPGTASRRSRGTSGWRRRSGSTSREPGVRRLPPRPERVRRYASDDVQEVAALARLLGGAGLRPGAHGPAPLRAPGRRGPATGVIDPLLVRAYLRAGAALPAHRPGDGTPHQGAALHLFATGVAWRVVKADVASLYPSLMRAYRIGPEHDHLGALLALVDRLVEHRLAAKTSARAAPPGSAERHTHEAVSSAMKVVVNSAYGYLAAPGLTRFADVHAANEVTRRGRDTLALMCRELAARGVTLLEADTDGVYFAVPEGWSEADERRVVAEVGALLPPLVQLEFEGRYAAMLSHEPKNYALLGYDGTLTLRGVAFRSSRSEAFGEAFLRRALERLFAGDLAGVREAYLATVGALRRREIPASDVASRIRLTKSPDAYAATRATRRELAYEALLASGRTSWRVGERVDVYRTQSGGAAVLPQDEAARAARRDYDAEHYARVLRTHFAARLARALTPEDFSTLFAGPDQLSLFAPSAAGMRPVLSVTGATV